MNKKLFLLLFFCFLLFPRISIAQNGIGEFIMNTLKSIFQSTPLRQVYNLERAILEKRGNDEKYLDALKSIEEKLLKYKRRHRAKFETTVNLTLALTRYEMYQILHDKETCINSYKNWDLTLKYYDNLLTKGGGEDLRILEKHGRRIGFNIDVKNWNIGRNWIINKKKAVEPCLEENFNCCGLNNFNAVKKYTPKLKNKIKEVLILNSRYNNNDKKNKKVNILLSEINNLSLKDKNLWSKNTPIAYNLMRGILYDLKLFQAKTKPEKREWGNLSHRHWNRLKACYTNYSYEYNILSKLALKKWGYEIDSVWIHNKYEKSKRFAGTIYTCTDKEAINFDSISIGREAIDSLTLYLTENSFCSPCKYKGCIEDSTAVNYIGDKDGELISDICIYKGCMDECYRNYNPNATIPDTCIELRCACKNPCYEGYNTEPDSIVFHRQEYCDTLKNICGCTNPCSYNYNPSAKNDTGDCIETCGCKDPDAVNYDPNLTYHSQDSCLYTKPINQIVDNIPDIISDYSNRISLVEDKYLRRLYQEVNFSEIQGGGGVQVEISQSKLRITSNAKEDLGKYDFVDLRRTVDFVMDFLDSRDKYRFSLSEMKGIIVGEADGYNIQPPGIAYYGDRLFGVSFSQFFERDRDLLPDYSSSLDFQDNQILIEQIVPDGLNNGDKFGGNYKAGSNGNLILAFVRAQKIREQVELTKKFSELNLGAIANRTKGGDYRRVTLILDFEDYNYLPSPNDPLKSTEVDLDRELHHSINRECLCE